MRATCTSCGFRPADPLAVHGECRRCAYQRTIAETTDPDARLVICRDCGIIHAVDAGHVCLVSSA